MKLNIVSWNSTTDINNDSTFDAWFETKQQSVPTRQAKYADRPERWKKLSGAAFNEHTFNFKVRCLGTIHSQRETVKSWFDMEDFTAHNLVFEDTADSNRQWYLQGIPTRIFEETPGVLSVTLATDEPFLRTVLESTGTLTVTASGDSTSFTVVGNMNARPQIKITPTSAKTGDFGYARWVSVYNNGDNDYSSEAIDFGGVNTAALIAANKMQSDGVDYLLDIDGNTADKWFGTTDGRAINTTDTALWGIIDLAPRVELPLKTAISSIETVTRMDLTVLTPSQKSAFLRAKNAANKVILLGSEAFTYSSLAYDHDGCYAVITERAAKGTSAASHSATATIRFLEHDIWQIYGSTDYTTSSTNYFEVDDNHKPMFDLHSTNTSHVYSEFRQSRVSRPGAWTPQIVHPGRGRKSAFYTGEQAGSADPATSAGMKVSAYQNIIWRGDTAFLLWQLRNQSGITNVQAAGSKYLGSYVNTVWPELAGLQYLHPTLPQWITADNQTIPTTSGTWQAVTIASTDTGALGLSAYAIRFALDGSVVGAANNYAALGFSGATVTLSSTGIPQVTVEAEQSHYIMNARIMNTTTGEWLRIRAVVALNRAITIDCDAKTVTYADGTNLFAGLTFSSARSDWLNLQPGANVIAYYETGAAGVTVGVEWENRNTL